MEFIWKTTRRPFMELRRCLESFTRLEVVFHILIINGSFDGLSLGLDKTTKRLWLYNCRSELTTLSFGFSGCTLVHFLIVTGLWDNWNHFILDIVLVNK